MIPGIEWAALVLFAETPLPPETPPDLGWLPWLWLFSSVIWLATTLGWIWMLVHCYQHEPDREFWFWVMILIPPAAMVYFFVRWLPSRGGGGAAIPKGLKRWSRGREIQQLEVAAQQIGNPHQWIQLGDALRDVGRFAEAAEAYDKALAKEADNIQALWARGSRGSMPKSSPPPAHLEKGLAIDPKYKFGDMSLAYGRVLSELGEIDLAADHLDQHVSRWRHPEALYLLATLELDRGNPDAARTHLQGLLFDLNGSPQAIARKHSRWKGRATRLLKQIPR